MVYGTLASDPEACAATDNLLEAEGLHREPFARPKLNLENEKED